MDKIHILHEMDIETWEKERLSYTCDTAWYIRNFVDTEKFIGFCRQCDRYNKNWSCPGFPFSPLELWEKYRQFKIEADLIHVPLRLQKTEYSEEKLSKVTDAVYTFIKDRLTLELIEENKSHKGLVLGGGCCNFCAVCSREKGLPCIKPHLKSYSIESLGGDVVKTISEISGRELKWPEDGHLPPYFITAGGILLK